MRYTILWSAAVASALVSPLQADQSGDQQELQGVWALSSGVVDGEPVPVEEVQKTILAFRGNRIAITGNKDGLFRLDTRAYPKAIEIIIEGQMHKGIYTLRGDQLKICLADPARDRPGGFSSTSGSKNTLLLLARDKSSIDQPDVDRPQEPKRPYPYDDREVVYENKESGIQFAGTLTLPRQGGPFPAVLLVTGSGQQDRDETHKGHRPFLVLADYLTRRGVAVLRVDDREMGGTTGSAAYATSEEFAADVLSGVEYLKVQREINPDQIGLVGHSEGGLISPIAASKSEDVAFVVMMAGPGIPGDEVLYRQDALLSRANGASGETITRYRAFQQRMFAVLKTESDNAIAETKIRKIVDEEMAGLSEQEQEKLATKTIVVDHRYNRTHRGELSPWFRFFLKHDPRATLRRVKCPVLAIFGENDLFVPPAAHLAATEEAVRAGGNTRSVVIQLPGLNHMFQTATTEAAEKYRETIAPIALQTIGDWIEQQTIQQ